MIKKTSISNIADSIMSDSTTNDTITTNITKSTTTTNIRCTNINNRTNSTNINNITTRQVKIAREYKIYKT